MLDLPIHLLPALLSLFFLSCLISASTQSRINCYPIVNPDSPHNPDPAVCASLISHIPSAAIARTLPSHRPNYLSAPFLPRMLYHAPTCIVRLSYTFIPPHPGPGAEGPHPDLALLSSYPPIFELYAQMKYKSHQIVNQCTGRGRSGGATSGVIRGVYWDVTVAPGPNPSTWKHVVDPPKRLLRGEYSRHLSHVEPGWVQTIMEVD